MRIPPDLWKDCFYHNKRGNKRLIVAFSHYDPHRRQRDTFSFYSLARRKDVDTLFVRDCEGSWFFYPQGVDKGLAPHFAMIEVIKQVAAEYEEVLFIGNSMGGWGALYFGRLVPGAIVAGFASSLSIEKKFNEEYRPELLPCVAPLYDSIKDPRRLTLVNEVWDLPKKIIFYEEIFYNDKFQDVFSRGNFMEHKFIGTGHNLLYAFYKMGPFNELIDSFFEDNIMNIGAETEKLRQKFGYSVTRDGNVFHFQFTDKEALKKEDVDIGFFISQNGQLIHTSYHPITVQNIEEGKAVIELPVPEGSYTIAAHLGVNKISLAEIGLPSYHEYVENNGVGTPKMVQAPTPEQPLPEQSLTEDPAFKEFELSRD